MLGLIYGLIEGSTDGWTAVPFASIAIGLLFAAAFAVRQRTATNPLIIPSLLNNGGFTSGLLLGVFFFAAVNGLAYVASLFLQTGLHRTPAQASLGLAPMMVGIMAAALIARPAIEKLGRKLVFIGLTITALGAAGMWAVVAAHGTDLGQWALAPSLLTLGAGMGACFGSIYDIAIGDLDPSQAGSAGGSLSAVQQLATAMGSATVTTIFFADRPRRDRARHDRQRRRRHADRRGVPGPGVPAARTRPRRSALRRIPAVSDVIEWCGFLGAWLLVAGPVYQAAIELADEALDRGDLERAWARRPHRPRSRPGGCSCRPSPSHCICAGDMRGVARLSAS